MSRRLPSSRRYYDGKSYQPTTVPIHQLPHNYTPTNDTGLSDDTFTDDCCYNRNEQRLQFSDDSNSIRFYENDNDLISTKRFSRNTLNSSDKSIRRHKIYPNQNTWDNRIYQEIPQENNTTTTIPSPPRRIVQQQQDRPHSENSGVTTSIIVDGCGGKCQTFENVCYFFLQLIFMMGILIGISLCIAGLVLRKSAARNLQVLVYIGILLAIVSSLLLGIQWNSRQAVKKRKLISRNQVKLIRGPVIPLETLNIRQNQQQTLIVNQQTLRPLPQRPNVTMMGEVDSQGVPWWRRRDIV